MITKFKNGLAKHSSGTYHYCLRINGRQYKGSTRATDLQTARKVLEERRRQFLQNECGIRKVPPLAEVREVWLRSHKAIHSPKHWREVETVSRLWLLPKVGSRPVDQITPGDLLVLRTRMLEAGRAPVTVNNMLKVLKLLVNFAVRQGHLKALPFRAEFLKVQKKPRPVLAVGSVQAFLASVDSHTRNPHVPVMVRVMVGLGLRESEVLGMRWQWFDPAQRTYVVGKAKGKEARVIPVPDWLWNTIHAMPKTLGEWVFPAADGMPHRPNYCRKALETVARELDLGRLTQHRLRATFATLHAEAGTPLPHIQALLGHKSVQTTMIYVEQTLGAKRKAQENLSQKLGLA